MKSNPVKITLVVLATLLLLASAAFTVVKLVHASRLASSPDLQGAWQGTVTARSVQQRVVLKISGTKGNYTGAIDSIDQGVRDIPITKLVYDYPSLSFEMGGGVYRAKVNPGATEISGRFTQGKSTIPVTLKRTATPDAMPATLTETDYAPSKDSDLQGLWKGTLQAGPKSLRLNFKFAGQTDGTFRAEMDSVDQGAIGLQASSVDYNRPAVKVKFDGIGGAFQGEVKSDKITGTWTQRGKPLPLTLERADLQAEKASEADKTFTYASKADLQGHWKGTLTVQKTKLRLALDIARLADGTFSGSLISLDQGANPIPATTLQYTAPQLRAEWKGIGGSFVGDLKSGKLSGTWRQGGGGIPLVFERN